MLGQILSRFFAIAFLQRGPQDLPASQVLLIFVVLLNFAIAFGARSESISLEMSMALALAELAILYILVKLVLHFKRLKERFTQTFTALIGCKCIVAVSQLLVALVPGVPSISQDGQVPVHLIFWVFWWLAIQGNILSHALETSKLRGALLSLWFTLVTGFMMAPLVMDTVPKTP